MSIHIAFSQAHQKWKCTMNFLIPQCLLFRFIILDLDQIVRCFHTESETETPPPSFMFVCLVGVSICLRHEDAPYVTGAWIDTRPRKSTSLFCSGVWMQPVRIHQGWSLPGAAVVGLLIWIGDTAMIKKLTAALSSPAVFAGFGLSANPVKLGRDYKVIISSSRI